MADCIPLHTSYLPDELLLEILDYLKDECDTQKTLVNCCLVNRQWYDVSIPLLYASPYLSGGAYALFVRTVCPSVNAHIKKSQLAGLVKVLDLSHIVHQGNKSTTARLLGRMKSSLEVFIAPQASFAVNCWASLSKCSRLRSLDLGLVSECVSYQSLTQTLRQLGALTELYLPRCSSRYDAARLAVTIRWPPRLRHLSLAGSIHGKFLGDMLRQPDNFPPGLTSLAVSHCPGLSHHGVRPLLQGLGQALTEVKLTDLPAVKQGRFNEILEWLPRLERLTIALDYIDENFAEPPDNFNPTRWREAKPLTSLTLVSSGHADLAAYPFTAVDLYSLIDERFLGRLRWLQIARSTGWHVAGEGAELGALEMLLWEVDEENWRNRRWHYEGLGAGVPVGMVYEEWEDTERGRRMRPRLRVVD
ncbi:hypothetical protein BDV95DRAFT_503240 [Massariosphaeria phaeospora]|uniref:F-box domain-containing protein n=1 Tax=Massariosphaeria phaeospora TaxID=100035 RepID=A0A7C8M491_9PLEO|nr:hypothetical protein BDV95DRAFT_503240 [Massariosphaeria phaeospora]